jgi:hypothetical protein
MTQPNSPKRPTQKYRLTKQDMEFLVRKQYETTKSVRHTG